MKQTAKGDDVWTIPNVATSMGFVFILLYIASFWWGMDKIASFSFLFLVGCSDALDGFLARRLDQHSALGAMLDPLRDRAIMIAVLWSFWLVDTQLIKLVWPIICIETAVCIVQATTDFSHSLKECVHIFTKAKQFVYFVLPALWLFGVMSGSCALLGMATASGAILFTLFILSRLQTAESF